MKKAFPILLVAAICMSFQVKNVSNPTTTTSSELENNVTSPSPANVSLGTYVGTLPCADCEGIRMKLTLQEGKAGKSKTFVMEQTYLGKPAGNNAVKIKGIWFPARGNKQDPNAVIVQLIPDGKYDPLYFMRLNEKAIKMLDRQQNPIKSKHNYILQKQR
ncbi:copper resistance protein NlpE [Pontibacter sp. MBLB2868]|uniref:copper resistance protein NlpE n=1 Tax=Pontibacter sp. MBLB2868 TaxID=3451555 RepID=UPI003F752C2A